MIVSNKVGAKDLIVECKNGFVIDCDVQALKKKLQEMIEKPHIVDEMNRYIVEEFQVKTMSEHAKEIKSLYKKVKN